LMLDAGPELHKNRVADHNGDFQIESDVSLTKSQKSVTMDSAAKLTLREPEGETFVNKSQESEIRIKVADKRRVRKGFGLIEISEPAELAAAPAAAPAVAPAVEPAAEPAAEPAVELAAEPAVELAAEPAVELAAEPAVELAAEPAVELAVEPAAAPISAIEQLESEDHATVQYTMLEVTIKDTTNEMGGQRECVTTMIKR
jgi:hypothetical protein